MIICLILKMMKNVSPQQDTGWGLIYRLNALFTEVEDLAPSGDYDGWNFKLDRIWSNLLYRTPMEIKKNNDGEIISIEFSDDDIQEKEFLDRQITVAKSKMSLARKNLPPEKEYKTNKEWVRAKKELYRMLLKKEIWLRKFMQDLGLYLKEIEHNPAGSMWGK